MRVGSQELHLDYACSVLHIYNQTVLFYSNIENHSVITANARAAVMILDVLGRFPVCL